MESIKKYSLFLIDTIAVFAIINGIIRYSFDNFLLQIFFMSIIILIKTSSRKVYDTLHIGLDLPVIICMLYVFRDNIFSVPILIYFLADLTQRAIVNNFDNPLSYFRSTFKLIIPLISAAAFFHINLFNRVSSLDVTIVLAVVIYGLVNILVLQLALSVYKDIRLFMIVDKRWIILYFTLQSFFAALIINAYINWGLLGFLVIYFINVSVINILNKSISIEKHQVTYKETLEYFVNFYDYGIFILDMNLFVLSVNDQFVRASNLPCKKIVGQNLTNLKEMLLFFSQISELVDRIDGRERFSELIFSHNDKQYSLVGVCTGNDEKAKLIFLLKDITSKQLKNIEYITKTKLESLEELAAGTANDIKNPLTTANGFLQLLKLHLKDPKNQYYVDQALKAISDTDEYIELFALLGNPSKDHHKFAMFNLTKLITQCANEIRESAEDGIKINLNVEENIYMFGKKKLMQKAISFIIDNALEAIDGKGEILLKLIQSNHTITIDVLDTGKGIKEQNLIKVFDPYFTTKSTHSKGFGLFYSKKILDQHNGKISIKSNYGMGTKVTIEIDTRKN